MACTPTLSAVAHGSRGRRSWLFMVFAKLSSRISMDISLRSVNPRSSDASVNQQAPNDTCNGSLSAVADPAYCQSRQGMSENQCRCWRAPFWYGDFNSCYLGLDENEPFAAVSVEECKHCDQKWLQYL